MNTAKHTSVDPARFAAAGSDDNRKTLKPSRRTCSEPTLSPPKFGDNPFHEDEVKVNSSSYKNDFRDSGGLEKQSVQELEETMKTLNNCLKIAEDTNDLITLHQQGEQITRTHNVAAGIDHDLSQVKKDDALSDLSDLLGEFKGMAEDMGSETERQNRSLTGVQDDVNVLNICVRGANQRGRRLLGK